MRTPAELGRLAARRVAAELAVPALRRSAGRRLTDLDPGVTVVTVSWNSLAYLQVLADVVVRRSPVGTRLLVVDNASSDGTREWLRGRSDVERRLLPVNLGHEVALDLGFLSARTEVVVALDVDAFPVRDGWIEELSARLHAGAVVAGARLNRDYVHPCCLAMRLPDFVTQGLSFRSTAATAPGELLSAQARGPRSYLEVTGRRGPGDVGTVFGDLIYHNFYSTRFALERSDVLDGRVRADDPGRAWAEAVARWT